MSRILVLGNSSSGLWDFRGTLLQRLVAERHEVTVSLPDDLKRSAIESAGCCFVHTPINRRGMNPLQDLKLLLDYRGLLKNGHPDLVLTYTIKPNIYGGFACRLLRIPCIITITGLGSAFQREGMTKRLVTVLYRIGMKRSRCVFFQNAENREIFRAARITGRTMRTRLVSGSGVDLFRHQPMPFPGHADDVVRFLYVGRLMREKGTLEYLACARRLHERYGGRVSVSAIGYADDDCEEQVNEAVKDGILKVMPFDPEIRPYLREADAVVMPSYHEGMSNVLMEASATARPVLASDISGCREIVDDGETGLLFPPRDADALFAAMERFLGLSTDERRQMGEKARAKMEREFDRRLVTEAYMEEIDRILTGAH
ncbi:MAG: glycosyltransferase family 4 protein [Lachnospiraceae bacterium]|nr:glycosyltransferase family 4 protein [Lachnospiraceae bacterium]